MNVLWPVVDLHRGNNQLLGIMTIAAVLEKHGHRSDVVDASPRAAADMLRKRRYDILAFSTMSVHCRTFLRLNRALKKEFSILSIFGGPHPTYSPGMIEQEGVDAVCVGEGEFAMLDLVRNLSEGRPITDIPNLWVKAEGRIHRNPVRPLVEDLDALPWPDHDLFRTSVRGRVWRAEIMTGRGCPYSCTYCFNNAYKRLYAGCGKMIRRRSVDNVIGELEAIIRHPQYRYIQMADDLFTLSPRWLKEFSEKYRDRIGLPFSCFARVEHLHPETVEDLKRAGCGRIIVGVETGDERIRGEVFGRDMSNEVILQAARRVKEARIRLMTTNIVGIPGASFEADLKTFALNSRIRPDYAGVNLLQPYPGTEIYECARSRGLLSAEVGDGERREVMITSMVKFPSPREKRLAENFEKFFSLVVVFPFLMPFVRRLIRWPQNPIFNFIHTAWTNFSIYFRIIPFRLGILAVWEKLPSFGRRSR